MRIISFVFFACLVSGSMAEDARAPAASAESNSVEEMEVPYSGAVAEKDKALLNTSRLWTQYRSARRETFSVEVSDGAVPNRTSRIIWKALFSGTIKISAKGNPTHSISCGRTVNTGGLSCPM